MHRSHFSTMMFPSGVSLDGVLLVDKPRHCTSHDVVARLRKKLGIRRIGHAGTLDPLATGLLIMLVGKATKASQYLMSLNKVYVATMKLGEQTDSQDSDGEITQTLPVPSNLAREQLEALARSFVGDQYQTPPMFSAKKVAGVPLYKLARRGETVEREPRFIHVERFKIEDIRLPEVDFELACSKGTYVRTIGHDFGQKLGCGAHLIALRRTRIDKFSIDESLPLEALEGMPLKDIRSRLLPLHSVVPTLVVNA